MQQQSERSGEDWLGPSQQEGEHKREEINLPSAMQGNHGFKASFAFHVTQCTSKQDGLNEKVVWLVGMSIREKVDGFYISFVFIFSSIHTCDLSQWFGFHVSPGLPFPSPRIQRQLGMPAVDFGLPSQLRLVSRCRTVLLFEQKVNLGSLNHPSLKPPFLT